MQMDPKHQSPEGKIANGASCRQHRSDQRGLHQIESAQFIGSSSDK
jgi:hypothetical protein